MNFNDLKITLIILLISSIFFTSCKTVKTVTNVTKPSNLENIYDSLKLSEFTYKNLNIKFNVKYENKSQTMSLKGNLKIIRDSIIWITLSPGLGIEAARLMCTRDSIFLLDKLHSTLTKGKYKYLNNLYKVDVDFHSLQSILTNNFFVYPSILDEKSNFIQSFRISKDSAQLSVYRKSADLIENLIQINRKSYKVNNYVINDVPNKRNLSINYNYDDNKENKYLPTLINIKSLNADKFLFVDLDYTKISVDEEMTVSFKIPADCKIIIQ